MVSQQYSGFQQDDFVPRATVCYNKNTLHQILTEQYSLSPSLTRARTHTQMNHTLKDFLSWFDFIFD